MVAACARRAGELGLALDQRPRGTGERIVEQLLARTVHGWLTAGAAAQEAADRAIALIVPRAATGIIVVTPTALAAAASKPMAWAGREGAGPWHGP